MINEEKVAQDGVITLDFNYFTSNCEHFARYCRNNRLRSFQVEDAFFNGFDFTTLQMFKRRRKMVTLGLFLSGIQAFNSMP